MKTNRVLIKSHSSAWHWWRPRRRLAADLTGNKSVDSKMWKKNFVEDNESYILMCLFTGLSCRVERIRPVKWSVWLAINQRGRSASCNGVFHSSGDWFFGWPTCRRSCFICRGFLCCFQPPPPPPPPRPPSSCLINEIKGNVQESRTNSNRGGGGVKGQGQSNGLPIDCHDEVKGRYDPLDWTGFNREQRGPWMNWRVNPHQVGLNWSRFQISG